MIENIHTAVITFGRFNPPTVAHRHLFNTMQKQMGDKYVFLSHTQDNDKNPLSYDEKLKICENIFPSIKFGNKNVRTITDAAKYISELGYDNLIYVAGGDRVAEFEKILNDYNNIEYSFDNINVVNVGERVGKRKIQNISASMLRDRAKNGDYIGFSEGYINVGAAYTTYEILRERLLE